MVEYIELINGLKEGRMRFERELSQLRMEMQQSSQDGAGSPFGKREEEATGVSEMEKYKALERRLNEALASIDHALEKYEAGTYGICDLCSKPISIERLEALPDASLCLECKAGQAKDARTKTLR